MRIALLTTFAASRKEPLGRDARPGAPGFPRRGPDEPAVRFAFGDTPVHGSTSAVDRALKRHPELARFVTEAALVAELDRTFVPEVERVAGPSPAWYTPES
jgi:hypothetical protein